MSWFPSLEALRFYIEYTCAHIESCARMTWEKKFDRSVEQGLTGGEGWGGHSRLCQSVLMQHRAMYTAEQKVFKAGKQAAAATSSWLSTAKPYILELLLLQEPQLLLPLLTDPRDEGVEKPELFTLLVHLEVRILKHNFKSIIREDIREALQERQGPVSVWI